MKGKSRILSLVLTAAFAINSLLGNAVTAYGLTEGSRDKVVTVRDITGSVSEEALNSILESQLDLNKGLKVEQLDPEKEVWVIVQLEEKSLVEIAEDRKLQDKVDSYVATEEGIAKGQAMVAKQEDIKEEMKTLGIEAEYKQFYTSLLNGFSAKIKYKDIDTIENLKGVKNVIVSEVYYKEDTVAGEGEQQPAENEPIPPEGGQGLEEQTPTEEEKPGTGEETSVEEEIPAQGEEEKQPETEQKPSEEVNEEDRAKEEETIEEESIEDFATYDDSRGAGSLIAIIDSGLDYNHSAFAKVPGVTALNKAGVEKVLKDTYAYAFSATYKGQIIKTDDVYVSDKIPFTYDYADVDTDVAPTQEGVEVYGNDHGTHVAGITAGNDEVIQGVAPEAQLVIMKTFSDKSSSAYTNDILAALCDAYLLGVDVINLSLGSSGGFADEEEGSLLDTIYSEVAASGINIVCSAGNSYSSSYYNSYGDYSLTSNPDTGIISSPSSYRNNMSVASINSRAGAFLTAGGTELEYRDAAGYSLSEAFGGETLQYVIVPGAGEPADYEGLDLKDKVAVVKRGTIAFTDKAKNAKDAGAKAVLIYNNRSGYLMSMSVDEGIIPAAAISLESGLALKALEIKEVVIPKSVSTNLSMSDFSSWGPLQTLELKPEITAPGGEIYSSLPFQNYGYMSGTSMASPYMAGVTAIVKDYLRTLNPGISEKNLSVLTNRFLMSTATPAKDENGVYYSPRKQGSGLVNLENALRSNAYLYVYGSDKTKLELGDDKAESGVYTMSFRLNNLSVGASQYTVETSVQTEGVTSDGAFIAQKGRELSGAHTEVVSVNNGTFDGNVITVEGGKDATITVRVTLSEEDKNYMRSNFENGIYVEGFVRLISNTGEEADLSIPYLTFFGDWTKAPMLDSDIFDDKEPSILDSYPLGTYITTSLYAFRMGTYCFVLPEGVEEPAASPDKISWSGGKSEFSMNKFAVALGLLRGAKSVNYTMYDETTGKSILSYSQNNLPKSRYSAASNAIIPVLGGAFIDVDIPGNSKLLYEVDLALDYKDPTNNKKDNWTFPVYVDKESPVSEKKWNLYEKEGKTYLDVSLTDNRYLMAASLFAYTGDSEKPIGDMLYDNLTPIYENTPQKSSTITFDVTDKLDKFVDGKVICIAYDYALNETVLMAEVIPTVNVTGVSFDKTEVNLGVNEILQLQPKVAPNNASDKSVTWSTSNKEVAVVSEGQVVALKTGSVDITATTTDGGFTAVCRVNVTENGTPPVKPTAIKLQPGKSTLLLGDTTNVAVSFEPWDTTDRTLTWSSSNEAVATVVDGTVTAVKAGKVTIKAESFNGVKGTCDLIIAENNGLTIVDGIAVAYTGTGSEVVIPEGVTGIGDNVFKNNKNITKVVIPDSVTAIGSGVFYGCTKLSEVNLPKSVLTIGDNLFYGCTGLTTVEIPNSVTSLGKQAFYGCTNLNSVKLSNSLTVLNEYLFYNCGKLTSIEIPTSVVELKNYVFNRCTSLVNVEVPNAVKRIGMSTFEGCTGLKTVKMPENLEALGNYTFSGCKALTSVNKWTGISILPYRTFYNCTSLTELIIPEDVTEIGGGVFYGCTGLTEINIPDEIIKINNEAFYGCTNAKTVNLPNSLKEIWYAAFRNCTSLKAVEIPDSVEKLDNYAFGYCTSLAQVKLPKNMNYIQDYLFYGSTGLKEFNFTENITTIGTNSFARTGLEKLTIPETVTTIKDKAFLECASLTDVTINTSAPLGIGLFEGCKKLQNVTFNSNTKTLSQGLFAKCSGLTTFRMPDSVEKLDSYVFQQCTSLKEIIIGKDSKLTSDYGNFGYEMFTGCDAFQRFTVEDGNKNLAGGEKILTDKTGKTLLLAAVKDEYIMPDTIEVVAPYAFYYNAALKNITLSKNLREIGRDAFYRCTALTNVNFNDKLDTIGFEAFYYCTKLTTLNLPNSVKIIGDYAFYNCSNVNTLNLGEGVRTIGNSAFNYTGITTLKLPNSLTSMGIAAFSSNSKLESVEFGTGLKDISMAAFRSCSGLKSVKLPDNIVTISDEAFRLCSKLESVTFGAKLDTIGFKAFEKASKLNTVNFNGSCKTIGASAFAECPALQAIVFPENLKTIGENAFLKNTGLKTVEFNEGLAAIGVSAFNTCTELTEVSLPDSLTDMGQYAFAYCSKVGKIDCGKGLLDIPDYGFYSAKAAIEVALPENLQSIGAYSFYDLNSVKELNLPATLKSIGTYGLYSMFNVQKMIIPDSVIKIGSSAFGHMYSVSELKLPNKLKSIEDFTFTDMNRLYKDPAYSGTTPVTKLVIPKTVEYISQTAFQKCDYLEEVEVEGGGNKLYTSKEGIVFGQGGKELFIYPKEKKDKTYVIPEGVKRLDDKAFEGNIYLENVVLPSSLERIGYKAFFGCSNLKNVTFLSEKAPLLEVDILSTEGVRYANFKDYHFYWDNSSPSRDIIYTKYDMVMYYPEISDGYVDTMNYNIFFDNKIPMTMDELLQVADLTAAVDVNHGVTLKWNPAPWADGYEISKAKDVDSILKAQLQNIEADYSLTASGPREFEVIGETVDTFFMDTATVYGETYYYTVRGYKVNEDGTKTYGQPSSQVTAYIEPNDEEAMALTVVNLIAKISNPVVAADRLAVAEARAAYDGLTPVQQKLVYNYKDLVAAEGAFKVADDVTVLINKIPEKITLEYEITIVTARLAYNGLIEIHKPLVENYDNLVAAEKVLAELKAEDEQHKADQAAANKVIELIKALPEKIALEDEETIKAARKAYDSLTDIQKALVENYNKLALAEETLADLKAAAEKEAADKAAAAKVTELIKAIPEKIALEDEEEIEVARKAYDSLTADQKEYVESYNKLVAAEETLADLKAATEKEAADKAAAAKVTELIKGLPEKIALEDEEEITVARKAYDALTSDQKAYVENYNKLVAAEETLAELKEVAEKETANKAAAAQVKELIEKLPKTITLKHEKAVKEAREAYDELTKEQKALVDNYNKLAAAEKAIADLKANGGSKPSLPTTGAMVGTSMMLAAGVVILLTAGILVIRRKKDNKK